MPTTDEKLHRVLNELSALSIKFDLRFNQNDLRLLGIEKKTDEIELLLVGDGGDDKRGVLREVDRLRDSMKTLKEDAGKLKDNTDKTFWSFIVAGGLLVIKTVWEVFTRKL